MQPPPAASRRAGETPTPPKAGPGTAGILPARSRKARCRQGSATAAPCSPASVAMITCGRDAWRPGSAPRPAGRRRAGRDARGPGPRLRRGCASPRGSRRRRGLPGCAGVSPARHDAAGVEEQGGRRRAGSGGRASPLPLRLPQMCGRQRPRPKEYRRRFRAVTHRGGNGCRRRALGWNGAPLMAAVGATAPRHRALETPQALTIR